MAIRFWLTRPRLLAARLRYWVWERMNPDKPWLCPATIAFCQAHLTKSMNALEFGSGRSTGWFATLVGHLISVEHDTQWYAQVRRQLDEARVVNVDYRLIPLSHPVADPELAEYPTVPDYVAVADALPDKSLHLAIVDGHYRTHCIRHLVPKIAPGGYLLVDDAQRWPSLESVPVPADWRVVSNTSNGIKRCVIWQAS
jgi:hypothetical protein